MNQPNIDTLYSDLKSVIGDRVITVSNLMSIVTQTMVLVQKYPNLSGSQKKQLVIDLIKRLVDESEFMSDKDEEAVKLLIQTTLPSTIDVIIDAYKHNIDLKKIKDGCFKLCK